MNFIGIRCDIFCAHAVTTAIVYWMESIKRKVTCDKYILRNYLFINAKVVCAWFIDWNKNN